jgi:hypothetical protein
MAPFLIRLLTWSAESITHSGLIVWRIGGEVQ